MLPTHCDAPRAYIFHDSEGRVLKSWKEIQQIHVAHCISLLTLDESKCKPLSLSGKEENLLKTSTM